MVTDYVERITDAFSKILVSKLSIKLSRHGTFIPRSESSREERLRLVPIQVLIVEDRRSSFCGFISKSPKMSKLRTTSKSHKISTLQAARTFVSEHSSPDAPSFAQDDSSLSMNGQDGTSRRVAFSDPLVTSVFYYVSLPEHCEEFTSADTHTMLFDRATDVPSICLQFASPSPDQDSVTAPLVPSLLRPPKFKSSSRTRIHADTVFANLSDFTDRRDAMRGYQASSVDTHAWAMMLDVKPLPQLSSKPKSVLRALARLHSAAKPTNFHNSSACDQSVLSRPSSVVRGQRAALDIDLNQVEEDLRGGRVMTPSAKDRYYERQAQVMEVLKEHPVIRPQMRQRRDRSKQMRDDEATHREAVLSVWRAAYARL